MRLIAKIMMALIPFVSSSAFSIEPDVYTIQQKSNFRYLDAYQSTVADYDVVTRPFQGDLTQEWLIIHAGNNRYTIQQLSTQRYLDAYERDNDFRVTTRPNQRNTTQKWKIIAVDEQNDIYRIEQVSTRRFLDAHLVDGVNNKDFSAVMRSFQANSTQEWILTRQ